MSTYAKETEAAIEDLVAEVDADACRRMWSDAMAADFTGEPVWFHGDIAVGNLLTRDGRLAAVIDFGTSGVGDPACDVVIAWTRFSGTSRTAFRRTLDVDDATWSRGRGWALWKALITLRGQLRRLGHRSRGRVTGSPPAAGLADAGGSGAAGQRMAGVNALLEAAPGPVREALVTACVDQLSRPNSAPTPSRSQGFALCDGFVDQLSRPSG